MKFFNKVQISTWGSKNFLNQNLELKIQYRHTFYT